MPYDYQFAKAALLTDDGQAMLMDIWDNVQRLLKEAGAFTAERGCSCVTGSNWTMLACLDRLVELKRIKEVTNPAKVFEQHRVFVAVRHDS